MSNKKQYTIGQFCTDLIQIFGEDYPVTEAAVDRQLSRAGDYIFGYYLVADYSIRVNIQKFLPDIEPED